MREDFLASHGKSAPACHACGKDQLKDDGLGSGDDTRRIVSCLEGGYSLSALARSVAAHLRALADV